MGTLELRAGACAARGFPAPISDARWHLRSWPCVHAIAQWRGRCRPSAVPPDGYRRSAEAAAPTLGLTVVSAPCGKAADAFDARARESSGGIIGVADTFIDEHRDLIIELAAWHHLPAVYGTRDFVQRGGLLAYSADFETIFHRAASYVDQTLRGVRTGDLPVQAPDKFTLSVNLRAAGAIGLTLPPNLISRADEVIE